MTIMHGYVLLIIVSLLTAVGQICFKKTALLEHSLYHKCKHPTFLLGSIFFICGPVISSLAAKAMDFSIMYAMTSLNFVFILVLSRLILKEKLDWPKILGVLTIIIGLLTMIFPFNAYI